MVCDIKEAYGSREVAFTAPETASADSDVSLQVSLSELEVLFGSLLKTEGAKESKDFSKILDELLSRLTSMLKNVMDQEPSKAGEIVAGFQPFFERLVKSDPTAMGKIKTAFSELFEQYAVKHKNNPVQLLDFLRGLAKSVAQPPMQNLTETVDEESIEEAPVTYGATDEQHMQSLANIFAALVAAIQNLEAKIMDSDATKNQLLVIEGQAQVKAAQQQLDDLIKSINAKNAAQAKADKAKKNAFYIQIAVAAVGVALACCTLGIGAAIMIACVSAFMMSPGFQKLVNILSEGMQPALDENCANAMAKAIIVVAIVVATGGIGMAAGALGGVGVAAEEGAEEGVEMASISEGAAGAAEDGADTTTSEATTSVAGKAANFAVFEGVSNLGATNPFMDLLQEGRGKKDFPDWALILVDVLCEVLCMIASVYAGGRMMKEIPGITPGTKLPDSIMKNYSTIMQAGRYVEGAMQLAQAGVEAEGVSWEFMVADITETEGKLNAKNLLIQIMMSLNSTMESSIQDTTQAILKGLQQSVELAQSGAGQADAAANNAIINH
jgi:hypothetical protein